MNTIADQYYYKAKDYHTYSLEESMENLTLALSYDNEHAGANSLLGKILLDEFKEYDKSEYHFQVALATDPNNANICLDYVRLLIIVKEYDRAEELINYTKKFKKIDLGRLFYYEGLKYESQHDFENAISKYEDAMLENYNAENGEFVQAALDRTEAKIKIRDKKKKARKKKE
jgi:tetratricopeptide (TPR) repeat protein